MRLSLSGLGEQINQSVSELLQTDSSSQHPASPHFLSTSPYFIFIFPPLPSTSFSSTSHFSIFPASLSLSFCLFISSLPSPQRPSALSALYLCLLASISVDLNVHTRTLCGHNLASTMQTQQCDLGQHLKHYFDVVFFSLFMTCDDHSASDSPFFSFLVCSPAHHSLPPINFHLALNMTDGPHNGKYAKVRFCMKMSYKVKDSSWLVNHILKVHFRHRTL